MKYCTVKTPQHNKVKLLQAFVPSAVCSNTYIQTNIRSKHFLKSHIQNVVHSLPPGKVMRWFIYSRTGAGHLHQASGSFSSCWLTEHLMKVISRESWQSSRTEQHGPPLVDRELLLCWMKLVHTFISFAEVTRALGTRLCLQSLIHSVIDYRNTSRHLQAGDFMKHTVWTWDYVEGDGDAVTLTRVGL